MQIHDEDVHVDQPSISASKAYPDQFADGAYQVAGIELSRITGDTSAEIYCQKISTEKFLSREQRLLTQLKQWLQSLPPHLRLNPDGTSPKHTIHMHLQFNFVSSYAIPLLGQKLTFPVRHLDHSTGSLACSHFANEGPIQPACKPYFSGPGHTKRDMHTCSQALSGTMCE